MTEVAMKVEDMSKFIKVGSMWKSCTIPGTVWKLKYFDGIRVMLKRKNEKNETILHTYYLDAFLRIWEPSLC